MSSKKLQRLEDSPVGTRFNSLFDNRDVEGLRSLLFGDPTRRLTRGAGGRPSPDDMCSLIHIHHRAPFVLTCYEGNVGLLSLLLEYLIDVGRKERSVNPPSNDGMTGLNWALGVCRG